MIYFLRTPKKFPFSSAPVKGRRGNERKEGERSERENLRKSRSLTLLEEIGSDEEPHFCRSSREGEKGIKKKEGDFC